MDYVMCKPSAIRLTSKLLSFSGEGSKENTPFCGDMVLVTRKFTVQVKPSNTSESPEKIPGIDSLFVAPPSPFLSSSPLPLCLY